MEYVNESQLVKIRHKGRLVPVEVITAAGVSARVVNELLHIDKWVHVDCLQKADKPGETK